MTECHPKQTCRLNRDSLSEHDRRRPSAQVHRFVNYKQSDRRAEMTNSLPETPNSLTGGCMCGAVRYRISEKPVASGLCHCNRCRPQSGSAFSTVIIIKRSTFQIEGETTVFEDVGASGLRVGRRGCARCGSPLTTEPDVAPDIMFVKAGGIDNNEWFQPAMELFVTRRRPWVTPVPGIPQFDGNPPI
jgi:hypothetical protein